MLFKQSRLKDLEAVAADGMERGDIIHGALIFHVPDLAKPITGDPNIKARLTCMDAQATPHVIESTTPAMTGTRS